MKNNKYKASIILAIFSLGFLISYPFRDNFWMGLMSGICAASMIGGFADWFAVTAIFRRPLGIYWPKRIFRTEIIPQNRDSIIKALVDIVENELLSKESIKKRIMSINVYEMFVEYVNDQGVEKEFEELARTLGEELYTSIKKENIQGIAEGVVTFGLEELALEEVLSELVLFSIEHNYDDILIDYGVDLATGFVKNNKMHIFFTNFVEKVFEEYESGSQTRAMTVKMLMNFVLKKSPSDIAIMVENNINSGLYELKTQDNKSRTDIKERIRELSVSIKTEDRVKKQIKYFVENNKDKAGIAASMISNEFEAFRTKNKTLDTVLGENWPSSIIKLIKHAMLQRFEYSNLEQTIKDFAISFVNSKHNTIGAIVRDNINQYSTEELVALIEGVAGNDLQMIRINGSVVGGLVGMLTYLLTYWIR